MEQQRDSADRREWIVLGSTRGQRASAHLQQGPYTLAEVTLRLQSGKLSYGDYAWRLGMLKWVRLGQLPELDPTQAALDPAPPPPALFVSEVNLHTIDSQVLNPDSNAVGDKADKASEVFKLRKEFAQPIEEPPKVVAKAVNPPVRLSVRFVFAGMVTLLVLAMVLKFHLYDLLIGRRF